MNTESNNNTNLNFDAFGLFLAFLSLGGIFNFIIFYIFSARAKSKGYTLFGHFYLGCFFIFSLYEFINRVFHPFIVFIFYLIIGAVYLLGILLILGCVFDSGDRLILLKELDDFTLKNKDIYIMSNEELKNFIAERNPQAVQKKSAENVSSITAENTSLNENNSLEVKTQVSDKPKILINTIKYEELSALPFFNSSFAEEALENRKSGILFNNMEDLKEFLHIDDQSAATLENLVTFSIKKKKSAKKNTNK